MLPVSLSDAADESNRFLGSGFLNANR
jgi:hypothetical protein